MLSHNQQEYINIVDQAIARDDLMFAANKLYNLAELTDTIVEDAPTLLPIEDATIEQLDYPFSKDEAFVFYDEEYQQFYHVRSDDLQLYRDKLVESLSALD